MREGPTDMNRSFFVKPRQTPERQAFAARLDEKNAAPLWNVLGDLVLPEPRPACVPAIWCYEQMRPLLMEAGTLISAQEAERRVLVLENPGLRGDSRITQSLYAGLQLIMPGEVAEGHRHAASALRLVIEGHGAYTSVNGERVAMSPGDFIVTPSWTYHDHGNPGSSPVVWMDGLDIPIVNTFDASFAEHDPDPQPPAARHQVTAHVGGQPLTAGPPERSKTTPVFTYPYARSRETLDKLHRHGPVHPRDGVKMAFVDPSTRAELMPTIGAFVQLLPRGFHSACSRSTDSTVYCVVEGHGWSHIGSADLQWQPHDIFIVPSWATVSHHSEDDAVLFGFSDRPVQEALGLWRAEQIDAG
jgi:gentisate 1,2-dioxygenase